MKCPLDNTTLAITNRNNIEIDYCPECRGVWLDRGELDKIIAHGEGASHATSDHRYNEHPRRDHDDDHHYKHDDHHKKHKKESFMGDLFDF